MKHIVKFLTELYVSRGMGQGTAAKQAQDTILFLLSSEWVSRADMERWERDAQMHFLRGNEVSVDTIKRCYQVSSGSVFNGVRNHIRRRREGLKRIGGLF